MNRLRLPALLFAIVLSATYYFLQESAEPAVIPEPAPASAPLLPSGVVDFETVLITDDSASFEWTEDGKKFDVRISREEFNRVLHDGGWTAD